MQAIFVISRARSFCTRSLARSFPASCSKTAAQIASSRQSQPLQCTNQHTNTFVGKLISSGGLQLQLRSLAADRHVLHRKITDQISLQASADVMHQQSSLAESPPRLVLEVPVGRVGNWKRFGSATTLVPDSLKGNRPGIPQIQIHIDKCRRVLRFCIISIVCGSCMGTKSQYLHVLCVCM